MVTLIAIDEVSGAYVAAYDVSNLNDIEEVDRIQAWSPQTNVIPHNTHVDGDFIVTSYYADGVSVVDVSNPSNMVEVGYYDTSEDYSGGGFNGAWGAYPWLPSGNILVTDIETGLYVLEPKYTNASFVEGVVVPIPTLDSDPSIVNTVVVTPPSLTLNVMSVFETTFEIIPPVESTVNLKSLSAQMKSCFRKKRIFDCFDGKIIKSIFSLLSQSFKKINNQFLDFFGCKKTEENRPNNSNHFIDSIFYIF